jgi:hypothetical protein
LGAAQLAGNLYGIPHYALVNAEAGCPLGARIVPENAFRRGHKGVYRLYQIGERCHGLRVG